MTIQYAWAPIDVESTSVHHDWRKLEALLRGQVTLIAWSRNTETILLSGIHISLMIPIHNSIFSNLFVLYKEYEVCQKRNRTEVPPKYIKFKLETPRFRLQNASLRVQFSRLPLSCLHATPGRILPEFSTAPSSLSAWWLPRPKNEFPGWPLDDPLTFGKTKKIYSEPARVIREVTAARRCLSRGHVLQTWVPSIGLQEEFFQALRRRMEKCFRIEGDDNYEGYNL